MNNENLPELFARLDDGAAALADACWSAATLRAYSSDWRNFVKWCTEERLSPLPASPETVARYAAQRAEQIHRNTIIRNLTSISRAHDAAGFSSPVKTEPVSRVIKGIRRTSEIGSSAKDPLLAQEVRLIASMLSPSERPIDIRDKAILLIGFVGAFKESELAAADVEDIRHIDGGILMKVRRHARGTHAKEMVEIGIPYGDCLASCPVRAYQRHLEVSGIVEGPVFRTVRSGQRMSSRAIRERIKIIASMIGKDVDRIGSSSLRSGFVVSSLDAGYPEHAVMRHIRVVNVTAFRMGIKQSANFNKNPANEIGL